MLLKKLAFAPLFLIFLSLTYFWLDPIFETSLNFLSLGSSELIMILIFCIMVILTSLFFVLLSAFSQDWKLVLPIALISAVPGVIFIPGNGGYTLGAGTTLSLIMVYLVLHHKLKTYFNFDPMVLFSPSIKMLNSMLILSIAVASFFFFNPVIQKDGFGIPESLFDSVFKLTSQSSGLGLETKSQTPPIPQIPKEQIELLKQNPEILKQYGLSESMLDELSNPKTTDKSEDPQSLIKATTQNLIKSMTKQYSMVVSILLSFILYSMLGTYIFIFSFFLPPIVSLIFKLLEKSGYITFVTETREVKKMVV